MKKIRKKPDQSFRVLKRCAEKQKSALYEAEEKIKAQREAYTVYILGACTCVFGNSTRGSLKNCPIHTK